MHVIMVSQHLLGNLDALPAARLVAIGVLFTSAVIRDVRLLYKHAVRASVVISIASGPGLHSGR